MAYLLSNNWNETATVKIIVDGWVVYFLTTQCTINNNGYSTHQQYAGLD